VSRLAVAFKKLFPSLRVRRIERAILFVAFVT
jgi:hypothetical protein